MTRYKHNGEAHTLKGWSRKTGISYQTLYKRVMRGRWTFADAITKPTTGHKGMRNRTILTANQVKAIRSRLREENASVSEIAASYYVHPRTIRDIKHGKTWDIKPEKPKKKP